MKLLLVQYRPAIRLYKWASILSQSHEVTIGYTRDCGLGLNWSKFDCVNLKDISDYTVYDRYISFNPGIDISYRSDIKCIQAVGDLKNANAPNQIEIDNLIKSDKCIFTSENQMNFAKRITNNRINADYYINGILPEMEGKRKDKIIEPKRIQFVYSGTITQNEKHHRNIIEQLRRIKKHYACDIHIYPSHISCGLGYEDFIVHESVSPYSLISELSQYDAGLFVLSNSEEVISQVLPNKVFEYLAAGIPVICDHNRYTEALKHDGVYVLGWNVPNYDHKRHTKYYNSDLNDLIE